MNSVIEMSTKQCSLSPYKKKASELETKLVISAETWCGRKESLITRAGNRPRF